MKWSKKTILITGGTGSSGKKFTSIMLDEFHPKKLITSRDELKRHDMCAADFGLPSLRYFVGNVRDHERLRRAMHGVNIVIHVAVRPAKRRPLYAGLQRDIDGAPRVQWSEPCPGVLCPRLEQLIEAKR